MRFGIMAMQLNALVPSGLTSEQILQHLVAFDHAHLIRSLAGAGFKLIELGGDLGIFFPGAYSPAAIEKLAALKQELDLTYTVHLPLWSVEPSTLQEPVRLGSEKALVDVTLATRTLEPEIFVLHATGALAAEFYRMRLPETARGLILQQFASRAKESIKSFLKETDLPSRKLAIETIEFPFELTLRLAEELDLSICLDTGHVLAGFSGTLELSDVLKQSLPRLGEIHLHDCPHFLPDHGPAYGKDHQALGNGDLDVGWLLDNLDASQFTGPIVFELSIQETLASLEAIHKIRPLIFEQTTFPPFR